MRTPLHRDVFYHDGRGPVLVHAYFESGSLLLNAIDYRNNDSTSVRHLRFIGVQALLVTPHEVENYSKPQVFRADGAAAVSLGQSEWMKSFSPIHLGAGYEHYRLMFYDEYVDVVCVSIEAREGSYASSSPLALPVS